MGIDENEFFRQATLRICGNLDFEFAMQECLVYLRAFMPADCLQLTLYDQRLNMLRTIAIATPESAKRVNIFYPLDEKSWKMIREHSLSPGLILNTLEMDSSIKNIVIKTGVQKEHSPMLIQLAIQGNHLGNLVLFAKGINRYTEEHLRLFLMLNQPFAIALSNVLRYDELNQLKNIMADDIKYLHCKLQRLTGDIIIGEDLGLKKTMDMARMVAPMDSPVLLQGETGVGKEIIAGAIHKMSKRGDGPFIQVNCGAIPETLIDSELFGHEKGAFTGAVSQKRGCFERADGGTIFLDEVAELPPRAQVRMLRVLQGKEILRVGGDSHIKVDIRIIAATHQNLEKMVDNGRFRADLHFRLNVFPITIPPLRDRKEDIPALLHHFIEEKSIEMQLPGPHKIDPEDIHALSDYSWTGNVRELENVVERAMILQKNGKLTFDEILSVNRSTRKTEANVVEDELLDLDYITRRHMEKVLLMTKGKINGSDGAAKRLGINPSTLRYRLKKFDIPFGRDKLV